MNDIQKQTVKLIDSATPHSKLKKWVKGYIPEHYKRLSISMDEAIELAELGAKEAYAEFETVLYFTQALLFGAVKSGKYTSFVVVTPSQYGKSWLCGQIAISLANKGESVYAAGATDDTTSIILGKVINALQTADGSIKRKLLESADKIERLQTAVSKQKIAFKGGGVIESISLGESYSNVKKGNKAVGKGGHYIIDEASQISDDRYAEIGRREFASDTGEIYISFEISNPHNPGRFFEKLTQEHVPDDTLIVWMDARTALEEKRYKSKEQIINSDFFKNKSTCKRYLLCELEDYSEESLFSEPAISGETKDITDYFLGVDSAYKGKDDIKAVLGGIAKDGTIRLLDHATIQKGDWVDGETSKRIIADLSRIIRHYDTKLVCVDIGYGVYLVEGLAQREKCTIKGINFGEGTTKTRKENRHFSAVYGSNKRAEMHLDMQDLMDNKGLTMTEEMAKELRPQMNVVKAIRKPNGKTEIIPKVQIKQIIGKSPDLLDAALLCIHAAILYLGQDDIEIYGGD